jgi:phosphodiesterase/alkaline phosphatase D-like protein
VAGRADERAFHEYMPMRISIAEPGRVYRKISYGPLLDVFMLDMRSYRWPNGVDDQTSYRPDAYFLGPAQVAWLKRELMASRATWKVIANDMPLSLLVVYDVDAIYLAHLAPHGVLVIHASNRHLDLVPVIVAAARAANLAALIKEVGEGEPVRADFKAGSTVIAIARDAVDVSALTAQDGWRRLDPVAAVGAWTDDHSNVLGALICRKLGW